MKAKRSPFERYQAYVIKLEHAGQKLPINQFGDVNYSQIASECGNRRQWFSENMNKVFGPAGETLEQILKEDIQRLGTNTAPAKDTDDVLSGIAETKTKEAGLLRSMLEQKTKENEHLRNKSQRLETENRILRSKVDEVESQQDAMLESGRRFTL